MLLTACCGGGAAQGPQAGGATQAHGRDVRVLEGRPLLAVLTREGDARGAIALAVRTGGIDADRGAEVAVALAALIQARLEAQGFRDAQVVPAWDGYRIRTLAADPAEASRFVAAGRAALLAPVTG